MIGVWKVADNEVYADSCAVLGDKRDLESLYETQRG